MKTTKSKTAVTLLSVILMLKFFTATNLLLGKDKKSSCCESSNNEVDKVVYNSKGEDSTKTMKHDMHDHSKMKMDKSVDQEKSKMNMEKQNVKGQVDIVRKGIIDLGAIDLNKDGKVFQDMMDWNVISDKPGKCPLCGMVLKEITLNKAKDNLKKHDFKVK